MATRSNSSNAAEQMDSLEATSPGKSVLLVEDDAFTRERLAQSISAHPLLEVTACDTLASARQAVGTGWPDVLVTDIGLPDGSGIELIREARRESGTIEIMVISVFGDEHNVLTAIEAGASGYLLKDGETSYLGDAILRLLDGESPISAAIARHILRRQQDTPATGQVAEPPPSLTDRERDVLGYMAKGYTYRETAELLGMSYHTVTSHVKHIYRKLEVRSRSEAIYEAVQLGLVDIHRD